MKQAEMQIGVMRGFTIVTNTDHRYQRCKPMTDKNIGRNHLKTGQGTTPHQGDREKARRARKALALSNKAKKPVTLAKVQRDAAESEGSTMGKRKPKPSKPRPGY